MASITGATTIITITIPPLFSSPQQLQGFAADDVFETDPIDSIERYMGVDGIMSAGFVFVPITQHFALQADSPSNAVFDQWWNAQFAAKDVLFASGVAILIALGTKW